MPASGKSSWGGQPCHPRSAMARRHRCPQMPGRGPQPAHRQMLQAVPGLRGGVQQQPSKAAAPIKHSHRRVRGMTRAQLGNALSHTAPSLPARHHPFHGRSSLLRFKRARRALKTQPYFRNTKKLSGGRGGYVVHSKRVACLGQEGVGECWPCSRRWRHRLLAWPCRVSLGFTSIASRGRRRCRCRSPAPSDGVPGQGRPLGLVLPQRAVVQHQRLVGVGACGGGG